jgi:multidrug efflux system membrane fusion protein
VWVVGILLLALASGGYWYWSRGTTATREGRGRFGAANFNQPVPIRVVPVRQEPIEVQIFALGTVTPLQTVTVRSRIDGELVRVLFTEGQHVEAGQLLAEIDARPSQAALTQAEGTLVENQARLRNAQSDLERFQKLLSEGLITKQQVTTQEALVDQYRGALQANQAQVNNAKVQLGYTKIVAPIAGRLGLRQVDPGNLIRSGDTNGLVVITMMRPISVLFTVPETDLPAVLEAYRRGHRLRVQAWDRAETHQLAEGELRTVDNQIDTATGTIKLRAEFANQDEELFPNQFVNIRLRVDSLPNASVIPSAAVQRGSFGTFVYLLKDDRTVTIRRVALGPAQGSRIAVTNGLKPGDKIVLEGVDQLKEGAKVEVIPDAPADASAPPQERRPASGGARAR